VKTVLQEHPREKRPRLRWAYWVKRDTADFHANTDWQTLVENRGGWRFLCLDVWSKRP